MRESSETSASAHAADEYALIHRKVVHADTVTENRAARERAGRVNCYDANCFSARAEFLCQFVGKRALSRAWWARDAEDIRVACMRVKLLHDLCRVLTLVFNSRDSLRQRKTVTLQDFISYVLHNLHHLQQYKGLPSMK